jgi:SAM-dependent methyltransferase
MRNLFIAGLQKTRNVVRGLKQRYGPSTLKERLWDSEFASGRWTCLDSAPGDFAYEHIERHANQGRILDLGCGPGATGSELKAGAYGLYTGVDISSVAICKATERAAASGRASTNRYLQADIMTYVPDEPQDVIVFGDSIYYIPRAFILPMLKRYSQFLKSDGVFVTKIYGRRYHKIMDLLERNCEILEKKVYAKEVFVYTFRVPATVRLINPTQIVLAIVFHLAHSIDELAAIPEMLF